MNTAVSSLAEKPKKRKVGRLFFVATLHFVAFALSFFKCLYFTFPGEPGYDAAQAAQTDFFAHYVVPVLGFPVLWISHLSKPLNWVFDGVTGWLWFYANSVLWAWVICLVIDALNRRRTQARR